VTFPLSAWQPDLFGVIALADFGATDWRKIHDFCRPPDRKGIVHEIEELFAMARDERPGLVNEILDQNARLRGYFAEVLMLSAWSHRDTLKIMEMATRVAQMVAVYFKLQFKRARPQQVCPALVPLINSPWHASFPSAHSLESHMIALALSEVRPSTKGVLTALADRIGRNREVAGVHYPSDTLAGKEIAYQAFDRLKASDSFQYVLKHARKEPGGAEEPHPASGRDGGEKT
jgi:acid phosphatase (class A)